MENTKDYRLDPTVQPSEFKEFCIVCGAEMEYVNNIYHKEDKVECLECGARLKFEKKFIKNGNGYQYSFRAETID